MIVTLKHRTKNAVRFYQQQLSTTWMLAGQNFAWGTGGTEGSESAPPSEPLSTSSMLSPLCAIKASLYLVYSDNSNAAAPFSYLDANQVTQRFSSYLTTAAAIAGSCRLVLASCQLTGAQLLSTGSNNFRQIGFATNVIGTAGHVSDTFLPSVNVSSWGDLESIQYRTIMTLESESVYVGSTIFSF